MAAPTAVVAAPALRRGRHGVARFVLMRLAQGLVTLLVVSFLIFAVTQSMPGDIARVVLGTDATPDAVARLRQQLGLDRPLLVQYGSWLDGVLHGNFGVSLASGQPVSALLEIRLRNSLTLAGVSLLIMVPLALVLGIAAAQWRDRVFDKVFLGVTMTINATPEFVTGTVLIALLGTTVFHVLPPVAVIPPSDPPLAHPAAMALPVLTVVLGGLVYLSRLVRVSFLDVMDSEYVQTARLKGLGTGRILFRHALPNALAPVAPALSLVSAFVVGGVVIVEYLYGYPGLGSALVDAVSNRDVPVIQAIVMIIAATYFVLNLVADTLSARSRR